MVRKITDLYFLDKINDLKYSVVFLHSNQNRHLKEIIETISLIDSEYSESIFLIEASLIKNNIEYSDITLFPSIFCFDAGVEEPVYFYEGVINTKKIEVKIKKIQEKYGNEI